MAETVTLGGVNYSIPDPGDQPNWATGLTPYLVAVAANVSSAPAFMQPVSVSASPTTTVSGKTYLVTTSSIAITLNLPAPATNMWLIVKDSTGTAATHNITLHRPGSQTIDGTASDKTLSRNFGTWIICSDGTNYFVLNEFPDTGLLNADVSASAAIAYSKLALSNSIVNADIASAAAIAYSKLAALTTAKALQSNSSTGFVEASSVTNTELGYVSGVTSAIQTQLNTKATDSAVVHIAGTESITGVKTFSQTTTVKTLSTTQTTNQIALNGVTHAITVTAPEPAADRIYTIPDMAANGDFVITAGAQTVTGNKTLSGTTDCSGLLKGKGTATNDDAAAGYIGEYISSTVAPGSAVTSTGTLQLFDITSIALTAGDWDVCGAVSFTLNSATLTNAVDAAISITSGNSTTGLTTGYNRLEGINPTAAADVSLTIPRYRVSASGAATAYLKGYFVFSGGSPKAYGSISARRVR